jgi:hypothetical protein
MASRNYSSTASPTTLSAGCTNSATSIQVTATTGFPAANFILALDYGAVGQELVLVTNVSGLTLTVTRGYDSTAAVAHSLGAAVQHVHAAVDLRDSRVHEAAPTGVHGVTGAVVGTTDTQAVSNKDLTSGTNTFPATVVTTTGSQTLTNKTLTAPKVFQFLDATNGLLAFAVNPAASAVNYPVVIPAPTTAPPSLASAGADTNIGLNLITKGTGKVTANSVEVATISGTQTFTNKTLTSPTINTPTIATPTITAPVIDTLAGVTGVGQRQRLKKGVDQNLPASTVLQNDTALAFPVVANAEYEFRLLVNSPASNGGIKLALALPAGATWSGVVSGTGSSAGVFEQASGFVWRDSGAGSGGTYLLVGKVTVSVTAGSVTLQWAQSVSDATNTTVKAGSYLVADRVA